jgi:cell wall-active antibiotic response 4TMS protein YvqF
MNCHYHPETEAVQECRLCSHPLCPACAVSVKGVAYCQDCLNARVDAGLPPAAPPLMPDFRSPRAAGWLSILPGLGLLYLGEYMKALVVALSVMGAIHLADHNDAGGFLVPLIWIGQIIYAVQEAKRLNRLREGEVAVPEVAGKAGEERDSPVWGGILIGLGTLFLLDQFDFIRFGEIFEKFWPLLIIGLGIQILLRGRSRNSSPARP